MGKGASIERETDRDRERETETDRQTDRQTDRERERERERESAIILIAPIIWALRSVELSPRAKKHVE